MVNKTITLAHLWFSNSSHVSGTISLYTKAKSFDMKLLNDSIFNIFSVSTLKKTLKLLRKYKNELTNGIAIKHKYL